MVVGTSPKERGLSEQARLVLGTDETRFRGFVGELVRRAMSRSFRLFNDELGSTVIALGRAALADKEYKEYVVDAGVPVCQRGPGGGRGSLSISIRGRGPGGGSVHLCVLCGGAPVWGPAEVAAVTGQGVFAVRLKDLLQLYRLFYKELGTGADVLLDLAKRAGEAGDKDMDKILTRLYLLLGTSASMVEEEVEAKQAAYSQAARAEVERWVEEAVHVLRLAKRAARRGDTKELENMLGAPVIDTPQYVITLGDILGHMAGKRNPTIDGLLRDDTLADPAEEMKTTDTLRVFMITADYIGWQGV